ncbi:MAG: hypothetical protein IJL74_00735 [Bacilli bacterium]|nr:hypothetical protein [Bacilli bacterium]
MNDVVESYVIGKQEGYFNVRLEYSILEEDQQCREFFVSGYRSGKKARQREASKESDSRKKKFNSIRKSYITIMGYKAAKENYTVDSLLLKGDDNTAFEEGYQIGLLCKLGKNDALNGEELDTYVMITGYETTKEGYAVYLDMLKGKAGEMFELGYKVKTLCDDIKESAIEELNNKQLDIMMSNKRKMN